LKQYKKNSTGSNRSDKFLVTSDLAPLPSSVRLSKSSLVNIPLQEQLFPSELEALKQMKSNYSICKNFSDEFIVASLLLRKLNLFRTNVFLEEHVKFRQVNNVTRIPRFSEINKELFKFYTLPFGVRCKNGSAPFILNCNLLYPNKEPYTLTSIIEFLTWFYTVGIFSQGMDIFRNGRTEIMELDGLGWKNCDYDWYKKVINCLQEKLPCRVRQIICVNAPSFIGALFKLARLFMKEKLLNRAGVMKAQDISQLFTEQDLPKQFQGNYEITFERQIELLKEWAEKNEERLIKDF